MLLFIELIHTALGHKTALSHRPTDDEWGQLYTLSKKQALLGITYKAIERLPADQRPPRHLLLKWGLAAERIKDRNNELNSKIILISHRFNNDGFPNVILKGQGIAQYYNICNLELYRTPGDVDIWFNGDRKDIIAYVRQYDPHCNVVYHHVDFPDIDGVQVEIHFTPSWMNCYFTNKKLQKLFHLNRESLMAKTNSDTTPFPDLAFNRVYILLHIYRHLFHEGIGLRQIMDYYFVLLQGFSDEERAQTMGIITSLKMERFTAAIMWILQEMFGMNDSYLLTKPNETDGKFLLEEIMIAGNLGKYDKRISRGRHESDFSYGMRKIKRNLRFIRSYPSEVLWSPIFKIWHYFWRKLQ